MARRDKRNHRERPRRRMHLKYEAHAAEQYERSRRQRRVSCAITSCIFNKSALVVLTSCSNTSPILRAVRRLPCGFQVFACCQRPCGAMINGFPPKGGRDSSRQSTCQFGNGRPLHPEPCPHGLLGGSDMHKQQWSPEILVTFSASARPTTRRLEMATTADSRDPYSARS